MQNHPQNITFSPASFGMLLPERTWTSDSVSYRYGFNTQERDDEIYGEGNSTTAEYWQYDSRLGRRWNTDPVVKEWESPYAVLGNNPILYIDPSGDDWFVSNEKGSTDEPIWLPSEQDAVSVFGENGFVNLGENLLSTVTVSPNNNSGGKSSNNYNVPDYLILAKSEHGVSENTSATKHNPRIIEYHSTTKDPVTGKSYTTDEVAWCASFINWSLIQAGYPSNENKYNATATGYNKWNTQYTKIDKPAIGAIAVIKTTDGYHVTFVIGINNNQIHGYGGNQKNQVKVSTYNQANVVGYYMPVGVTPNYNVPTIKHNFNKETNESSR